MDNYRPEHDRWVKNSGGLFVGLAALVAGGLIGAGAMLLMAPRSGKKTWAKIQHKGMELRDQVTETVEDAIEQTRGTARRVMAGVHKQTEELQQRGQDMLDDQKEIVSQVVEAEKAAVHNIS
jgi:gas vesicle protein